MQRHTHAHTHRLITHITILQRMQKPMHIDIGAIVWQCNNYAQFLLLENVLNSQTSIK